MTTPDYALFYDLETTGTDEAHDGILEVGCVLVDLRSPAASRTWHRDWLVRPTPAQSLRLQTNDAVHKMHVESGLLDDLRGASFNAREIDERICSWLRAITGSEKHVLSAGSGVAHFDRRFLKAHMPKLDRRLTYYSLDVGVIRRACDLSGRPDLNLDQETGKNHRALTDAKFHYIEWRWYTRILAEAMAPVPDGALQ